MQEYMHASQLAGRGVVNNQHTLMNAQESKSAVSLMPRY